MRLGWHRTGDERDIAIETSAIVAGLCALVACLAIRAGWLPFIPVAHVNERSLHTAPVRTSAGIAIVLGVVVAWTIRSGLAGTLALLPVMTGTLVLSLTGLADDIKGLSARLRFSVQIIVVIGILLTTWPSGPLFPLAAIPLCIAIVWFINLFNFMDGSDGLAASQTITACVPVLGWSLLGDPNSIAPIASSFAALIAASIAFLFFNWPKAKMFMGDAGSLAIPFMVAGFVLSDPVPGTTGLLVLIGFAPFITDASLTLAIRVLTGEIWWSGHRTHAYQLAARRSDSHLLPLAAIWVYGVFWVWPLSVIVMAQRVSTMPALLCAYLPVAAACALIQWRLRHTLAA